MSTSSAKKPVSPRLAALARNLWWTWDADAQRLFGALDPRIWEATNHDPLATLAAVDEDRRAELDSDAGFQELLTGVEERLRRYLAGPTWFSREHRGAARRLRVAYFCAEFGLHESLPLYAGGLGMLAGDHLKSASDLGVPLVAVGLAYRCGYYRQSFAADGATIVRYSRFAFGRSPMQDTGTTIGLRLGGRTLHARVWRLDVGRVPLFLLDADVPANAPREREITRTLYGGDAEMRIRQEFLLGVGGVRALHALGYSPGVFHLNEGHAAFCILERLRQARQDGDDWERAVARVRAGSVFTTHTPVAAGHDRFPRRLMRKYFAGWASDLGIGEAELLELGAEQDSRSGADFCMTALALLGSARRNGVSRIHGQVSRQMWEGVLRAAGNGEIARPPRRSAGKDRPRPHNAQVSVSPTIGHVTNGIHVDTWLSPLIRPLYEKYLRAPSGAPSPEDDRWSRAARIPDGELWAARGALRRQLVHFVRARLIEQAQRSAAGVAEVRLAEAALDEDALTLGFARRFATYKRAPLLFRDPRRLAAILNHPQRPAQLIFAGKAHPRDADGQRFAQQIWRMTRRPEFRGRVVLLENYDMHVGRMLTSGCDVWLNNPLPPQEASGTSGMKPALHGGLNCSILDGWWPEAFNGRNGWGIEAIRAKSAAAQDRHDAEALYALLESQIAPRFYQRNRAGVPAAWVRMMKESMRTICARFSARRMVGDYVRYYYL